MPLSIFFGTNLQSFQHYSPQPRVDSSYHLQLLFGLVRPVDLQIHLYGERHPAPTRCFVMHVIYSMEGENKYKLPSAALKRDSRW